MSTYITTFEKGSEEYEKLQIAALMLTNRSPRGYLYEVGETYFDFGQNWKWTTIMCWANCNPYQALNPREQEEIILSDTYDEMVKTVELIFTDKFCPDKKE
jgi:hypothetical protein